MAPPSSAAPTLVTFEIANWRLKSSLRCSGRLRSMSSGDWTTKKAWFAAPTTAAHSRIATGAVVRSRPMKPSMAPPVPSASTSRRPIRSDRMLAGKAKITPAAAFAVAAMPMKAGSKSRATR